MWKHDDYLLWVCINNMPVIQWMCGISLKLGRRGICHLPTPFTLTLGIFLTCTESKSSLSWQAAHDQKQVCFQHSQESVASDNWLKPGFLVDRQEFRQLFLPAYQFTFSVSKARSWTRPFWISILNWQDLWCFLLVQAQGEKVLIWDLVS